MKLPPLLAALLLACAPSLLFAQTGADACSTADPLAGQGSFAFDNSSATTGSQGQGESLCYLLGSSTVDSDVWFSWTAEVSGIATVSSCTSSVDTKLAAYPGGGCPAMGSALACNDDACGLQSEVSFPVAAGSAYMLQVGSFPGAPGGAGQLDLSITPGASNDACATPDVIAGQGSFAFDNGGATTGLEGQSEALCYSLGSSAIERDVWFRWTADATGTAVIATCGSGIDTRLAGYVGGSCPTGGGAIACNDDSCGLQSVLIGSVMAGQTLTLQIGSFPGASGGTGVLDISIQPQLTADDCATPQVLAGRGSFAFDTSIATTGIEGQSETLCYQFGSSGIAGDVWYEWTASTSGLAKVSTCGTPLDTKLAAYPAGGCPTDGTALACNDDSSACGGLQAELLFPVVAGSSYLLQLGHYPGASGGAGSFEVSVVPPAEPGTAYCFCDGGNSPCNNGGAADRGCANGSDSSGAQLMGAGIALVGADSVTLMASGLPPGQPGLYFQGMNQVNGGSGNPFGDGLRCTGGDVRRLGVSFSDASGNSDTSGFAQPISVLGGVALGDQRNYQLWYRDPVGSPCGNLFNLSNGYAVQW
jgi:hypothetical protein